MWMTWRLVTLKKIHDGDGEITAEQEEQQELLDGQQQQSTK